MRLTPAIFNDSIISELAAFERLLLVAFDAAEAERMTVPQLIEIPSEQMAGAKS